MMSGLTIDHSDATAGRQKPVEHDRIARHSRGKRDQERETRLVWATPNAHGSRHKRLSSQLPSEKVQVDGTLSPSRAKIDVEVSNKEAPCTIAACAKTHRVGSVQRIIPCRIGASPKRHLA